MEETLDSMKKKVLSEAEAILTLANAYQQIKYAISIEERWLVVAQLKGILEGDVQITQTHYWAQALYRDFVKKDLRTQKEKALAVIDELEKIVMENSDALLEFH